MGLPLRAKAMREELIPYQYEDTDNSKPHHGDEDAQFASHSSGLLCTVMENAWVRIWFGSMSRNNHPLVFQDHRNVLLVISLGLGGFLVSKIMLGGYTLL